MLNELFNNSLLSLSESVQNITMCCAAEDTCHPSMFAPLDGIIITNSI